MAEGWGAAEATTARSTKGERCALAASALGAFERKPSCMRCGKGRLCCVVHRRMLSTFPDSVVSGTSRCAFRVGSSLRSSAGRMSIVCNPRLG